MRACGCIAIALLAAGCDLVFDLERPKGPPGVWEHVAAGERHTCGIKTDGTLWCWGENRFGAVGAAEEVAYLDVPTQIGDATWTEVSTKGRTTCGIQTDGSLWCWGYNANGQTGVGTIALIVFTPTRVGEATWSRIAAGVEHTCGVDANGGIWCWGYGLDGRLGDGFNTSSNVPVRVPGDGWSDVVVGFDHSCGRYGTAVACWGSNFLGQLADPTVGDRSTPNVVEGDWSQVTAGDGFTCLRDGNRAVTCFGLNDVGQLGNGSTRNNKIGSPLGSNATWSTITAGRTHACGLRDGALWCWGSSDHGEVPTSEHGVVASLPLAIEEPELTWKELALGQRHTCAIDNEHRLYCAGGNSSDELGQGTSNVSRGTPAQVEGEWKSVALGTSFTCALSIDGGVSCWGRNDRFQLGDGTQVPRQAPDVVGRIDVPLVELVVGAETACVRGEAKDVRYCWGKNDYGELGDVSSNPRTTTAEVPREIHDKLFPSAMAYHACGFDSTPTAMCWGQDYNGQVGTGSYLSFVGDPSLLATAHAFSKFFVGPLDTCGIDNGTVACWGLNLSGQLGVNSFVMQNAPTDVAGLTGIEQLALGLSHTCAVDAGGAAWCWGSNVDGQLGIGPSFAQIVPKPIGGMWRQLAAGEAHTCAIALDGTLWCWGSNVTGQLGDGSFRGQSLPLQIGSRSDWSSIVAGPYHTCALAGTSLWCWGQNSEGELGTNTAWREELVRVPD